MLTGGPRPMGGHRSLSCRAMDEPPTDALRALLAAHRPADAAEAADLERMRAFATSLERPFSPGQRTAHFTGSAMVVDAAGARVCLVHHRKLGRWLQPGGHAEPADGGRIEARRCARRARRRPWRSRCTRPRRCPLDVDVHPIPARGDVPAHLHLDVRVLVVASGEPAHDAAESHGARWFALDEGERIACDGAPDRADLLRLFAKTRRIVGAPPARLDRRGLRGRGRLQHRRGHLALRDVRRGVADAALR